MANVAFIPARGGSKSIPLKNIRHFAGQPLIYWTLRAASRATCIDRVILATDSETIRDVARAMALPKVEIFNRNEENAADASSTESVMLEYLSASSLQPEDCFFLIQATSPLLQSTDIEGIFAKMNAEKADSALTGVRIKRFFWRDSGVPWNYDPARRPRRQDFNGMFMENGACYVNSISNILRDKNRLSGRICLYEMPACAGIELDEPDDWIALEAILRERLHGN